MMLSRRATNPFRSTIGFVLLIFVAAPVFAQIYSTSITSEYRLTTNVTYLKEGAWEGKLDIYYRTDPGPHPTLIFIGGGGAMEFVREDFVLQHIPYLEWGWNVVNVGDRLPGVTLAPGAINNCFCAMRWIVRNAKQFGFDTGHLVISGTSSGGWAALATAMIPRSPGWDQSCPGDEDAKIAAVVNWYGVSDLHDLIQNPNPKSSYSYMEWIRNLPNPMEIAKAVSPINFVRPGVPPVISIHGDADQAVPYTQSVRLHEALKRVGVAEELITIPGGVHGGFTRRDNERAYAAIRAFLTKTGAPVASTK